MHRINSAVACEGKGGEYVYMLHHRVKASSRQHGQQPRVRLTTLAFPHDRDPMEEAHTQKLSTNEAALALLGLTGTLETRKEREALKRVGNPAVLTVVRLCGLHMPVVHGEHREIAARYVFASENARVERIRSSAVMLDDDGCGRAFGGTLAKNRPVVAAPLTVMEQTEDTLKYNNWWLMAAHPSAAEGRPAVCAVLHPAGRQGGWLEQVVQLDPAEVRAALPPVA